MWRGGRCGGAGRCGAGGRCDGAGRCGAGGRCGGAGGRCGRCRVRRESIHAHLDEVVACE
ncbi:hypothetical protein FF096_16935 [Micromonospora sp. CP22]|nr:hypothetical protein [Micromonospora sp. CP22]